MLSSAVCDYLDVPKYLNLYSVAYVTEISS